MKVIQIPVGQMQNFAYLIANENTKKAAVIDPGFESEKIIKKAEENNLKIEKILLTHFHYDHSNKAYEISKKTKAKIYAHKNGKDKIKDQNNGMWVIPEDYISIEDQDEITLGEIIIKAVSTEGHQNDHLSYIAENNIFTGDALFIDAIGRTDLPDSDYLKMQKTLEYFKSLPDEMIIYPGHDYGAKPFRTIGEEKEKNRFLQ